MSERLGDLIELPAIKLVIELDDADTDPAGIARSFVLTREVEEGLNRLLRRIEDAQGGGVFLKGNFGSGKSHFLSFLYLLFRDRTSPLLAPYPRLQQEPLRIVKIPLVKYPSSRLLEHIVLDAFGHTGDVVNRERSFAALVQGPTVILIDELSEFLRSKVVPATFYEDLRFLQFLGEFSGHHPLWIVASLQEWIEETGHIASNIFNRIKDRYPLRINLSSSHVEDIIDQRVILKKAGAEAVIRRVFDDLRRFYPRLQFRFEDFYKTYPLHPFTVRYLSGLTPVFSQHRGVIHFVGAEARRRLDGPPDELITPEVVFDHFEERIREIPEFSKLARTVFDYYRPRLAEILPDARRAGIALDVLKILILTEISALEKRKTAVEIAEILLKKISTLKDKINYDYIRSGILEPLALHQMYIKREGETYFIDTAVDEGLRIKARIKAVREKFADPRHLFAQLCRLVELPHLPLRGLSEGKRIHFRWQSSPREAVAILHEAGPLTRDEMAGISEGIARHADGHFLFLSPFQPSAWVDALPGTLTSPWLEAVLFWVPRPFGEEETVFVEEYLARHLLTDEFPELQEELRRSEAEFRETVTRAYFEGRIVSATGRALENLREVGFLPLEKLFSQVFDAPLRALHPDHHKIMPRVEFCTSHQYAQLFEHFIRQGRISVEDAERRGLTMYLRGVVEPLGIVNRRGAIHHLSLDADNELLSQILTMVSQDAHPSQVRLTLKKGRWGLTNEQINLMLAALIVSGHLIPYGREEIIDLKDLGQLASNEILRLRPGRTLPPELLAHLPAGEFIWGEVEKIPTPLTQRMMWKEAAGLVRKVRKLLEEIDRLTARYRDYTVFKRLGLDTALLNRLALFMHGVTISGPAAEGIERFLAYLGEHPDMKDEIAYLERVHLFLNEQFQLFNNFHHYLTHPSLRTTEDLEGPRARLAAAIEEYERTLGGDFAELRAIWDLFFDSFKTAYSEGHERYYAAPVFRIRRRIEDSEEAKALRRIARAVSSLAFPEEWWGLKKELDRLPEPCREDLNSTLFSNPVCRCGYRLGDAPPESDERLDLLPARGVIGFLRALRRPENKEKLDASLLGLTGAGRPGAGERAEHIERIERVEKLLALDPEKATPALLMPLLTDDLLEEIEKTFKGRWQARDVLATDFLSLIRGRRFRRRDLVELFMKWVGEGEETIIHVKDEDSSGATAIRENLARYGAQGERLARRLEADQAPEALEKLLDSTAWNLSAYGTDRLFDLLRDEQLDILKKKLRGEIFTRHWGGGVAPVLVEIAGDALTRDLLESCRLAALEGRHRGVEVFTRLIAPLSLVAGRLRHRNIGENGVDPEILEKIQKALDGQTARHEAAADRYDGAADTTAVRGRLEGTVVVLDGLRYDLWQLLRQVLEGEGWNVKEETFRLDPPSSTAGFRRALGIDGDVGTIDGRPFALLRWAERARGVRELKRFLKGSESVKFLHFNFIDVRLHHSTLELYPLFVTLREEFVAGILPILKEISPFTLLSDHGFIDTGRLKDRYTHGGSSPWETVLPWAEVR